MVTKDYLICQDVTIYNRRSIYIRSEHDEVSFIFDLDLAALEFTKDHGKNIIAFVQGKQGVKLLLLCNRKSGELYIPNIYSEQEKVAIRQVFVKYLFNGLKGKEKHIKKE